MLANSFGRARGDPQAHSYRCSCAGFEAERGGAAAEALKRSGEETLPLDGDRHVQGAVQLAVRGGCPEPDVSGTRGRVPHCELPTQRDLFGGPQRSSRGRHAWGRDVQLAGRDGDELDLGRRDARPTLDLPAERSIPAENSLDSRRRKKLTLTLSAHPSPCPSLQRGVK